MRQLMLDGPDACSWATVADPILADSGQALVRPGPYACGTQVTIADVFLVPQVANARRLKVSLDKFPKIVGIDAACLALPAFDRARPENQPDAE